MKKKKHQSELLSNLIEELDSTFDLKQRLRIATNRILQAMDSEISSIMLMDREKKYLVIEHARGLDKQVIKNTRVKIGEGVSGWVAKQGEPLLITDLRQDRRFPASRRKRYYNNSLLSVPLRVEDEVLGVINVNNKKSRGAFNQEDLKFLTQIATHLAKAIKNARKLPELKSKREMELDLLSCLSHEMRNCLSSIKEGISLISEGIAGKLNQKQASILKLTKENINRLTRLASDFLDFSKLQSGRIPLNRALVSLEDLARRIKDLFKIEAEKNRIQLELITDKPEVKIWADPDRLSQVFTNLLSNSLKFTPPGGKVSIKLKDRGRFVETTVRDTGIGIYATDRERIFDKFKQAGANWQQRYKGSGLGLAIVKEIIQMHKGKIWVQSSPGRGTKFIFILPKDVRVG